MFLLVVHAASTPTRMSNRQICNVYRFTGVMSFVCAMPVATAHNIFNNDKVAGVIAGNGYKKTRKEIF